ncbi:serine/threonine-protein kinase [Mycobacterium paragordonae]|uniref:non-specific serine/threonine protein kinase n=1 Tax=Mycobacterium paragordonae TaxID=1389713 RepID=A0ABQ1C5A6_9MYCO|nr:serine/threonine-protein kinase [Mycobacterium paragordonae]GFG79143.1 hypothetical protein MPRG_24190 [Mycobacterium paragordonae]
MGDYQRLSLVHGAGTTVWKGFDPGLRRDVALKGVNGSTTVADARRTAEALSVLRHPNIVSVYDAFDDDAGTWLVEQWVSGAPLPSVLSRTPTLLAVDALALVRGVLTGLAHAHDRGVVHGRISPASIMIDESGTPLLGGFGATQTGAEGALYTSPDVAAGGAADERSDVYSVCMVLVELLSGQKLVADPLPAERTAPDLSGIGAPIAAVLASGLHVDPRHRPADASVLLARLDEAADTAHGKGWLATVSLGSLGSTAAAVAAKALAGFGSVAGAGAGTAAPLGIGSVAGAAAGTATPLGIGSVAATGSGTATPLGIGSVAGAGSGTATPLSIGSAAGAGKGKILLGAGVLATVVAAITAIILLLPHSTESTASQTTTTTTTTPAAALAPLAPPPPPPPAGPRLNGTYSITATFRTATVTSVISFASDCAMCDATLTANGKSATVTWNGTGWEHTEGGACVMRHVLTPTSIVDGIVQTFSQISTILTPGSCGVGGDGTGVGTRTGP